MLVRHVSDLIGPSSFIKKTSCILLDCIYIIGNILICSVFRALIRSITYMYNKQKIHFNVGENAVNKIHKRNWKAFCCLFIHYGFIGNMRQKVEYWLYVCRSTNGTDIELFMWYEGNILSCSTTYKGVCLNIYACYCLSNNCWWSLTHFSINLHVCIHILSSCKIQSFKMLQLVAHNYVFWVVNNVLDFSFI